MCGIAGYFQADGGAGLLRMMEAMLNRGPDDSGSYAEPGLGLGMRRLAIMDPARGQQPFYGQRSVLVYNGEIYNHVALRRELEARGVHFRSHCDGEVIPWLYEKHGPDFIKLLEGVFALALWDRVEGRLILARDAYGVRPLHYCRQGVALWFASTPAALISGIAIRPEVNRSALFDLMRFRFAPGNETVFDGVLRLTPGHALIASEGGIEIRRWNTRQAHRWNIRSREDAVDRLDEALHMAVQRQIASDVPWAIALSGGIDSSLLLAVAARHSSAPCAVSLGLGPGADETAHAAAVAKYVGAEHVIEHFGAHGFESMDAAIEAAQEPKINILQGHHLFRAISSRFKMSISGLGGDELFLGYFIYDFLKWWPRHPQAARVLCPSSETPSFQRLSDSWALPATWSMLSQGRGDLLLRALRGLTSVRHPDVFYRLLRNDFVPLPGTAQRIFSTTFLAAIQNDDPIAASLSEIFSHSHPAEGAVEAELCYKLPDDFLLNEDRMSMAWSVESRVPFLDDAVVDVARSIPIDEHLRGGKKSILKELARRYLPPSVLDRPKQGFSFDPVAQWDRGLRAWLLKTLDRDFIESTGVFRWSFIEEVLNSPARSSLRWNFFTLWQIAAVQLWWKRFIGR